VHAVALTRGLNGAEQFEQHHTVALDGEQVRIEMSLLNNNAKSDPTM
jgi:hypothetical protein